MRRVYAAYILRRILTPLPLKLIALGALASFAAAFVSYGQIFQNLRGVDAARGFYRFGVVAFQNTEFAVQAMFVAGALLFVFLLRDIVRSFRTPRVVLSFNR